MLTNSIYLTNKLRFMAMFLQKKNINFPTIKWTPVILNLDSLVVISSKARNLFGYEKLNLQHRFLTSFEMTKCGPFKSRITSWTPLICLVLSLFFIYAKTPPMHELETTNKNHLRGLCVVNDKVVWASGANGTFLQTKNGGKKWKVGTIPHAAHLDFRDIHAFDANNAMVLSAGEEAAIYKTNDAGTTWKRSYHNTQEGVFFDGMDFADEQRGAAFSDPIDGKLLIIQTKDGGNTWQNVPTESLPDCLKGEAGYAASGTGIVYKGNQIWIATGGGAKARVFHSANDGKTWNAYDTPMVTGNGKGIFSMTMLDELNGVVVGGSYIDSTNQVANCAITADGGKTWELVEKEQPNGYRSCVANANDLLVAVGRTGIDFSKDKGRTWKIFSHTGYYACGIGEKYLYAVGKGGKMAKIKLKEL